MKKLLFLMVLLFGLGLSSCQRAEKEVAKKPNILFLFADDLTYEAIHALGNEAIETPNLDRLVSRGTSFTHAYNMGGWNGAICAASRAMMISGRSIWHAKRISKDWSEGDSLALGNTWGQLMEDAGYQTYMTGKWHVEAPADVVFQEAKNVRPGMPNDYWSTVKDKKSLFAAVERGEDIRNMRPKGYYRPLDKNDTLWDPTDKSNGGFWEGGKHWSEVVKDDAKGFLDTSKDVDKPFFMYLAFNASHDPRQSPQEYLDKYPLEDLAIPANFLPEYPFKDAIGNSVGLRDEALAPFPRTPLAIKTHLQEYYAIISHMDAQIGEILAALETSGELENTYIFFTGDHGLAVGHHGLLGKQSMFDHSVRVPLMMAGPGVPKGKQVNADVYLQDIMATALELAEIQKPPYVDFNSLFGLAKGEHEGYYQEGIYGAYVGYQRMIRKDGYKLLVYPKMDKVLLFDMENDPQEMHDLADAPEQQERVKSLFEELMQLQQQMGDPLDISAIYAKL
ncbi:choline-sulfatase [Echinicola strongylocentroti]|uniref:Choline-sulfatase n=1 Tax=Echinicola strongylocentroti TaxID=1795355 RepID=A0A2Z4IEF1_9BACT|nr:sulfatase-like hydrolase/transferase [Echinicola strongylocentroti]AWW29225.1 choline-sulfatase [Echinicola strongylocentroti]